MSLISLRVPIDAPEQSAIAFVGRIEVNVLIEMLPELPSGARPSIERLHRHGRLGVVARSGCPSEDDEAGIGSCAAFQLGSSVGELLEIRRLDWRGAVATHECQRGVAVSPKLDV